MDYGAETVKRQTWAACGRKVKVCGRRLSLQPIGYWPALSVMQSAAAAAVAVALLPLSKPYLFTNQCTDHHQRL